MWWIFRVGLERLWGLEFWSRFVTVHLISIMIAKKIISSILVFVIHTASYGQNVSDLSGKWISETDKSNVKQFKGNIFYDYYDNELTETGSFFLSNNCKVKSRVLDQNKPIFLNEISSDNYIICNEITSLTKNRLTLMYSENGKISTFLKQKNTKRKKVVTSIF